MKFCPKCGRQLADGEFCNCQSQQVQYNGQPQQGQFNGQPQQGQFNGQPQQGQFNGQPQQVQYNGRPQQGQFNGQPQYNSQPQQTSPIFQDMGALIKGLFKTPVASISNYVNNASAATSCIIVAILAVIAGIKELIYIAGYNIKHPYSTVYEGVDIFTNVISNMLIVIGTAAVFALIIMVLINTFEKEHKVTYTQALAVACLVDLVYWPVSIVTALFAMIPLAFFGYLSTWIGAFAQGASLAIVIIGIRAVEKDDNHMPIVYGVAMACISVITTVINLIF